MEVLGQIWATHVLLSGQCVALFKERKIYYPHLDNISPSLKSATFCSSLRSGLNLIRYHEYRVWVNVGNVVHGVFKHPLSTHPQAVASSYFGDELHWWIRPPILGVVGQQLCGSMFRVLVGVKRDGGRMEILQRRPAWRQEWVAYK